MEKLSLRDHVLLGYSPPSPRSFGNPSSLPNTQHRISDIDFNDVFGGPPRCSIQDRHSLGETSDSYSFRKVEEETRSRSWSATGEKPVFGEDSPNRRRHLGRDFYNDIFRGDNSSSSAPRNPDRDPFSTLPSSQIQSPIHPSTPKREPLSEESSLPLQLSLSSKLAKGVDFATFSTPICHSPNKSRDSASKALGYPSSPSAYASRVAAQTVLGQDDSRNEGQAYRQSPLSYQFSISFDGSSKSDESASQDTEEQCVKDPNNSEVSRDSSQFHFSIYKWASKGVTLTMPVKGVSRSNSKERDKNESIVSELPAPVLQGVSSPSLGENLLKKSRSFRSQYDEQDNSSSKDINITRSNNTAEEVVPSKPELKPLHSLFSDLAEEPGLCKGAKKEVRVSPQEACKSELRHLHQVNDNSDGPGNDEMVQRGGDKDGVLKSKNTSAGCVEHRKEKKRTGEKGILNHSEATKPTSQESPSNSQDKMLGNRLKGKVKEFIKIFNQEASPKLTVNVGTQGQSFRRKSFTVGDPAPISETKVDEKEKMINSNGKGALPDAPVVEASPKLMVNAGTQGQSFRRKSFNVGDSAPISETKVDGKEMMSNWNGKGAVPDAPVVVDQTLKQTEQPYLAINFSAENIYDSSRERNGIPTTSSDHETASPKLMGNVGTQGQTFRRKLFTVGNQVSISETKVGGKEEKSNWNGKGALPDAPVVVDQILKQTEKPYLDINFSAENINDSSRERNGIPTTSSGSTSESFQSALGNTEEPHCEDLLENCMVEHISVDQKELPQIDQHQEEIQISAAKIRQWSNGKEGNIRSLLSTLQYVLWPESGWKPVPLVDIIEGSSVKRAYQKALLCLHPDKLQQKGVSEHKKYVAEKVFNILQEAWTHFSELCSL
ncbi:J-domain protein required for chloroplast accumulation response 1 isoform X2 [Tasmannia lanceolata]|uniref:J-domain protein required for chloroplast accumulation response 1 isoform X2 n=1 Tax=Tasmannia lanceolata TaxID=3420 RepID=UPI004063FE0C